MSKKSQSTEYGSQKGSEPAILLMKTLLGLKHTKYSKYCADVFIDVTDLKG